MQTKVVELTGYHFGQDEDVAAEIVWQVTRTCREKQLKAVEIALRPNSILVTLNVELVMAGCTKLDWSALDAWLQAATAHLVTAVTLGCASGRLRSQTGAVAAKVIDG